MCCVLHFVSFLFCSLFVLDDIFSLCLCPKCEQQHITRDTTWPLHKDDTLFQSGRPTGLNIYFTPKFYIQYCSNDQKMEYLLNDPLF